jgi:hypothetical protein
MNKPCSTTPGIRLSARQTGRIDVSPEMSIDPVAIGKQRTILAFRTPFWKRQSRIAIARQGGGKDENNYLR